MKIHLFTTIAVVLVFTSWQAEAKPLGLLAFLKKSFVAGFVKGAKLNSGHDSSPKRFRGSASGNLEFSGQIAPTNSGNGHNGQFKLYGKVKASGRTQPVVENGRTIRRKKVTGNVSFNANLTSNVPTVPKTTITRYATKTYAPTAVLYSPPLVQVTPATVVAFASVPMSNGYGASQAHIYRSTSGMPYGTGNYNINVANAGSGTGAIIHLNTGSPGKPNLSEVSVPTVDRVEYSSTAATDTYSDINQSPPNSYLPPDDDIISSDYSSSDTFDNTGYVDDQATNAESGTDDTYDYNYVAPTANGDYQDYSNDYDVTESNYHVTATTEASAGFQFDINASGSGSLTNKNGYNGEANANFDSSLNVYESDSNIIKGEANANFDASLNTYDNDDSNGVNFEATGNADGFINTYDYDDTTDSGTDTSLSGTGDYDYVDDTSFTDGALDSYLPPIEDTSFTDGALDSYLPPIEDTQVDDYIDVSNINSYLPPVEENFVDESTGNQEVTGEASGITGDVPESSIRITGTNSQYDSFINTNVRAVKELSDIALRHGEGLPVTIRVRTRQRVRKPSYTNNVKISQQPSSGHDILNYFTGGSIVEVAKAPLLYKYSDVIESPDAIKPAIVYSANTNIEKPYDDNQSSQINASGNLNLNLNFEGNLGRSRSRSVSGGRVRVGQSNVRPSRQTNPVQLSRNIGKAIPAIPNQRNTVRRVNQQTNSTPSTRKLRPVSQQNPGSNKSPRITNVKPRNRAQPIPSVRTQVQNNRPVQTQRRSQQNVPNSNMLRPTGQTRNVPQHFRQPLRQNNQAQRQSNNRSQSRSAQRSKSPSFVDMLSQFAESHRLSLVEAGRSRNAKNAMQGNNNRSNVSNNRGKSPSSQATRSFVSSLDRKENSGISRATLKFKTRDTIPPSRRQ